jgi:hypothetical protein
VGPGVISPSINEYSAVSFNPSLKKMETYKIFADKFGGYS